jgi:hypothetical protein
MIGRGRVFGGLLSRSLGRGRLPLSRVVGRGRLLTRPLAAGLLLGSG